jgi:tRNA threonylcarbamoyladenosine biosynthesis protein TsaB
MPVGADASRSMNILAIDTCLGAVSVGIGRDHPDGKFSITECFERRSTGHAERLMPMIEAEMTRAGLAFRGLQRVAVTLGPGSFTGVRTGIAVARALRLAAGVDIVGASSLAVMAHRIFESGGGGEAAAPVMIAVDARRGRLYAQLFGSNALDPLTPPSELTAEAAAELALGHSGTRIAGSGAVIVAEAAGEANTLTLACGDVEPHAGDLIRLAPRLAPMADVKPIYIRPPDAKPQGEKRLVRMS